METQSQGTQTLRDVQRLIDTVVRYILSGGVFVLAVGFLEGWQLRFLRFGDPNRDASLYFTTLVIAVAGAVAYLLHRSLLYSVFRWCLERWLICRDTRLGAMTIGGLETELGKRRYEARASADSRQQQFDQWAAEVHFLYTAAWCVAAATVLVWLTRAAASLSGWKTLVAIIAFALLVLAAVFHDARLMREEIDRLKT